MFRSEDLDHAITLANERILNSRGRNALWSDFRTEAGHSDEWVSGFAAYALAQTGSVDDRILVTLEGLLGRQRKKGGWSYNESIPADSDSTGWVLMALSVIPGGRPSVIDRGFRFLKSHQDAASGGFCTYAVSDGIDRVIGSPREYVIEGWLSPQPCVTALVLQSFLLHGQPARSRIVRLAAAYLLQQRCESGTWPSYWWKGYAYSTYLCMKALWAARRLSNDKALRTLQQLLEKQNPDGGWNDDTGAESEVFATAFCLLSLMLFPESGVLSQVSRGVWWLLERQEADGKWPTSPILRIPAPMVEKPEGMTAESWLVMQRGTGTTVSDLGAIYTSSAAIWALGVYRRLCGKGPFQRILPVSGIVQK